jgi:hypothetical protein
VTVSEAAVAPRMSAEAARGLIRRGRPLTLSTRKVGTMRMIAHADLEASPARVARTEPMAPRPPRRPMDTGERGGRLAVAGVHR